MRRILADRERAPAARQDERADDEQGNGIRGELHGRGGAGDDALYGALPTVPRAAWPTMMHGMGYNFEFYDAPLRARARQRAALDERGRLHPAAPGDAGRAPALLLGVRHRAQGLLQRSHRDLYADFFRRATGGPLPERYPRSDENPWLAASKRWTSRMRARLEGASHLLERARYALG